MNLSAIRQVAVVGAGTMGAGVALCFARAGYPVVLYSRTDAGLERARRHEERSLALMAQAAILSPEAAQATLSRQRTTTQLVDCLDGAQFAFESIPEQLYLKQALFREMETLCPSDTILATNTSGLRITDIATACEHPNRVIGMHWINPPEYVPLVEVISGQKTEPQVTETTRLLAEHLGKMAVVIKKDVPGFASNRLQFALLREALALVEAGVLTIRDLDRVLRGGVGFRCPWLGPLETADLGGLDVFHAVASNLFGELNNMITAPGILNQLVEAGKLGLKTGEGFYSYQTGDKERLVQERDRYFIGQLKLLGAMTIKPQE